MKLRLAVLLTALLISATVLGQATLGPVYKLGTSTHANMPTFADGGGIQGGLIFNLDAGAVYVNNGTAWAALGSTETYWRDAGSGYIHAADPIRNADGGAALTLGGYLIVGTFTDAGLPVMAGGTAGGALAFGTSTGGLKLFNGSTWADIGGGSSSGGDYWIDAGAGTGYISPTLTPYVFSGGVWYDQNTTGITPALVMSSYAANYTLSNLLWKNSSGSPLADIVVSDGYSGASIKKLTLRTFCTGDCPISFSSGLAAQGGTGLILADFSVGNGLAGGLNMYTQSGSNAVSLTVTGARVDLGAGTNDHLASDGTGVTTPSYLTALQYRITPAAPTAFAAVAATIQADSNGGRTYVTPSATRTEKTPFDFGGHPHPVMQQRMYIIDPGHAATTPMEFDVAPRLTGGRITVTTVDAAAATASGVSGNNMGYGTPLRHMTTAASAGSISSMTTSAAWIEAQRAAPRWCERVNAGVQTSVRHWVGLASALPGASDTPLISLAGFRFSTAAPDTAWMYCVGDGTTTTCATTGVTPNNGTGTGWGADLLCVDMREGTAVTFWVNGVAIARVTANIPLDGDVLKPIASVEALAASTRTLSLGRMSIEVN